MEIFIGIDIVEIEKFKKAFNNYGERFLKKIFTPKEILSAQKDLFKLCILFSFKESIWKALPERYQKKINFKNIEILWENENHLNILNKLRKHKLLYFYSYNFEYVVTFIVIYKD